MADPDREGGGGLSVRTLAIASAASLTAATATSRIFPPGTIYASALTPVIVAAVSEILHRPADRVSEIRRQRRTLAMQGARSPSGEEGAPLRGAPGFARGAAADEELGTANGNGTAERDVPQMTIHGRSRRRLLHPKVWVATGLVAFAVAVAALTLPELIFGGAIASGHRTTYFGGGSSSSSSTKTQTTTTSTQTQPQKTVTHTVPAQTPAQSTDTQTTPTETQTTPTPTDTGTSTAPSGGTPTPTDTGTSTSPAP
jgi:hypothetical protein